MMLAADLYISPDRTTIVAHADHDGIAASAGLIETFGKMHVIFSPRAINARVRIPENTKTVILAD